VENRINGEESTNACTPDVQASNVAAIERCIVDVCVVSLSSMQIPSLSYVVVVVVVVGWLVGW